MEFDMLVEDDFDILDIIDYGFPRRVFNRENYFQSMDDLSFFRRFRLRKPTVLQVLQEIEHLLEFDNDLNNSVTPVNQLLTTLRFFACGNHQIGLGDFMGMHQTTVSRVVKKVSYALASLAPVYIRMPNQQEILTVQQDFYRIARFPKVIGCVDGTHVKIQSPGGQDGEIFRNRKGYFSLNVQAACDSHLKIRDIVCRWPGSTHDMTIFNNSRMRARMEGGEYPNCLILGDSGYALREYCLTPLPQPGTRAENLYNEAHIRTRNTIERTFGVWKRRFPAIAYGLRCNLQTSMSIIIATAVLHNIAIAANEDMPPVPENVNQDQLNYLIAQGNIPDIVAPNNGGVINYRRQLIDNHFLNLN